MEYNFLFFCITNFFFLVPYFIFSNSKLFLIFSFFKFTYLNPVVSSFPIYMSGGTFIFLVYLSRHLPSLVISS